MPCLRSTVTLDPATTTSVASTTTLSVPTTWVRGTTTLPLTSTEISTIVSETTPSTTLFDTTTTLSLAVSLRDLSASLRYFTQTRLRTPYSSTEHYKLRSGDADHDHRSTPQSKTRSRNTCHPAETSPSLLTSCHLSCLLTIRPSTRDCYADVDSVHCHCRSRYPHCSCNEHPACCGRVSTASLFAN